MTDKQIKWKPDQTVWEEAGVKTGEEVWANNLGINHYKNFVTKSVAVNTIFKQINVIYKTKLYFDLIFYLI